MPDGTCAAPPILAAERVSKSFGKVPVLFSVSFDIRGGEVHALIGENGAGKSTLMKILTGFHPPTSGSTLLEGAEITLPPNGEAEDLGIVMIHQELNLAEQMTVAENVFLGRELAVGGFLRRGAIRQRVAALLDQMGLDIRPEDRVSDLSIAQKQMVEIVKAISRDARVLIMDEPTAALTPAEADILFRQIDRLKSQGVGIVFVSHKLAEVKAISDRVTVLRDGRWIATRPTEELTPDAMAGLMVGRELSDLYPPQIHPDVDAPKVLEVSGLSADGGVRDVSFNLRRGEILGFAGLIGSGRTAAIEAICGLNHIQTGDIRVDGKPVRYHSLADARDAGLVYLTKDRKDKGLLLDMGMRPNVSLLALRSFVSRLLLSHRAEDEALDRAKRRFDIRARDPKARARDLSGGNQQKLLLAKVMECQPRILVIDEPTRGIDIGTKQQIYHFIAALAADGVSVILISSEMPEIIGMSHRVVVMRDGHVAGVLEGAEIEEGEIMLFASGLKGSKAS